MNMSGSNRNVMVLAGGPDRERPVSLMSAQKVVGALKQAGHDVRQRDVGPGEFSCLDEFVRWPGDILLPVLHGPWGEGGGLQREVDRRGLPYVGSAAPAAALCMDKHRTKLVLTEHGLATPPHELVREHQPITLTPPVVIKPIAEGSSIDLSICKDDGQVDAARTALHVHYPVLLIEQYIEGMELTVGILCEPDGPRVLPLVQIISATEFYDYQAKYERQDTRYICNPDLPLMLIDRMNQMALNAHKVMGCRHLSRVDFMVDRQEQPWILEINTLPGLTSHSLIPMAAAAAGISLPDLVDRLVSLAWDGWQASNVAPVSTR